MHFLQLGMLIMQLIMMIMQLIMVIMQLIMLIMQLIMLINWPLQVMLSSVQAYKGGYMAGQQHAWQAGFEILSYS